MILCLADLDHHVRWEDQNVLWEDHLAEEDLAQEGESARMGQHLIAKTGHGLSVLMDLYLGPREFVQEKNTSVSPKSSLLLYPSKQTFMFY